MASGIRPDYALINDLLSEHGMGKYSNGGFLTPAPHAYREPSYCLTKNCDGYTHEFRTWAGPVIRSTHVCA